MNFSLETQRVEGECDHQTAKTDAGAQVIDADFALATSQALLVELFQAQLREIAGLATITAWGFTGSDLIIESDIHTLDLAGMNTSRVVSTWRGSGPGIDGLSGNLDAHRVSGLDCLNPMPTNGDLLQGIGDADSLIEDLNLWMDEEQVRAAQDKACPRDRNKVSLDAAGSNSFYDKSQNNEGSNASGEPDRARAIKKDITSRTHRAIFSQQPGLEGSRA